MHIVLLPGLDGTGDLFSPFASAIEPMHETQIVSYPITEEYSYQALTDLVTAVLPDDRDYVLLGESFSGPVAIAVAAQEPKRLKGIILCCSFARNPMPMGSVLSPLIRVAPVKLAPQSIMEHVLFGKWSNEWLSNSLRQAISKVPSSILRSRLKQIISVDAAGYLRSISVPLLYLQAGNDRLVSAKEGKYVKSILPTTKLVELSGPHGLLQACPVESAIEVNEFLREVDTIS